MSRPFRFSHRANRADAIPWRPWTRSAFDDAAAADRPVLLHITAAWCHWCDLMDEEAYSDEAVIELLSGALTPVRVDSDDAPHIRDRYIASGWPTVAFLTPGGEVLWAGTYLDAAGFREVADGVLQAWAGRRDELASEIRRRKEALEAARERHAAPGTLRREDREDVLMALRSSFDTRNGGFGNAPKFPPPDAVELLFELAERGDDADWSHMAEHTLDGMLAGELMDSVEGGFYRYALEADWTAPRYEKLLEANAGLVHAYAVGGALRDRQDWKDAARAAVEWVETRLSRRDGLWGNSQAADPAYFQAADRVGLQEPPPDLVAFTAPNALWVRALAGAGARLGREDWIARAGRGLDALLDAMEAPGALVHHGIAAGEPWGRGLLEDVVEVGRACLEVAATARRPELRQRARRLARTLIDRFQDDDGGFVDHLTDEDSVGALAYRERPFLGNAGAAVLLLELADDDAELRAPAREALGLLAPVAARYGPDAATFVRGVELLFPADA